MTRLDVGSSWHRARVYDKVGLQLFLSLLLANPIRLISASLHKVPP